MHALEWIAEHGRFLRRINAAKLRRALQRTKGQCTWCGEPVAKGRVTWCSNRCVEEFRLRCDPSHVGHHIKMTRPLICAICGADLAWLKRTLDRPRRAWQNLDLWPSKCVQTHLHINRRGRRNRRRQERWASLWSPVSRYAKIRQWAGRRKISTIWEADHVVPVVEGGGLCGPEGYRILCRACHAAETAKLAARRAAARRPAPKPSRQRRLPCS